MQETWVGALHQEDPLEKKNGNPFQYSCLGNATDRGAWWAIVEGIAKIQTQLKQQNTHAGISLKNIPYCFTCGLLFHLLQ